MSNIANLLDKARERRSLASDNALAQSLHVSRSIVSEWRKGTKPVPDDRICALASMAGEDAGIWLVKIHAESAHGDTARAWAKLARQLGAAAVVSVAALLPLGNAQAAVNLNGSTPYALCEVVDVAGTPVPWPAQPPVLATCRPAFWSHLMGSGSAPNDYGD